jgi:hypothetical protein
MLGVDRGLNIVIAVVLILLCGCGKTRLVDPHSSVLVQPVFDQMLVVQNDSTETVTVVPLPGSGASPIVISPGRSDSLNFEIQRIIVIEYVDAGIDYHWSLQVEEGKNQYLGHRNGDLEVQVKRTDGEIWPYRIEVGECWYENNPPTESHELIIEDEEPIFGVPSFSLCR